MCYLHHKILRLGYPLEALKASSFINLRLKGWENELPLIFKTKEETFLFT